MKTYLRAVVFIFIIAIIKDHVLADETEVYIHPDTVRQGGILTVDVTGNGIGSVQGLFNGTYINFFRDRDHTTFSALVGVDLSAKPGEYPVDIRIEYTDGRTSEHTARIRVVSGEFGLQRLKLPKRMVEPDKNTLERIKRERNTLMRIFGTTTMERFWNGGFIMPVEGPITSEFGLRRIINNTPKARHSGVDIAAPAGRGVIASNRGKVVFTGELFFSGKTIVIDHGLGLYTMYFHLSGIRVKKGEMVEKGRVIGLVGSTGRSSGPHLHWGVRLNMARINPLDLLTLSEPGIEIRTTGQEKNRKHLGGE